MTQNDKYFKLFGLEPGASKDEIRRAYRKLVMKYHPDRNPSPEAEKQFLIVKEAYDILMGKKNADDSEVGKKKNDEEIPSFIKKNMKSLIKQMEKQGFSKKDLIKMISGE